MRGGLNPLRHAPSSSNCVGALLIHFSTYQKAFAWPPLRADAARPRSEERGMRVIFGQAGAAALGIEPLVAGEASRLVRVRCPEGALAWFESLTPSLRGYLVMEAHGRARRVGEVGL